MTRLAALLIAAGCGAAPCVAAPGLAAAAAPLTAVALANPLAEQVLVPAPTGDYLWRRPELQFQRGTPLLWPDATVRSFAQVDGISAGDGPGEFFVLDPNSPGSALNLEHGLTSRDRLWGPTVVGSAGRAISLEQRMDGTAIDLVERDENVATVRSRRVQRGSYPSVVALVATARGLRGVTNSGSDSGRHATVRVVDRRGRTVARARHFHATSAVAMRDGSVLILGLRGQQAKLVSVHPGGRLTAAVLHNPRRALYSASLLQSATGPLLVTPPSEPRSSADDAESGDPALISRVSATGRLGQGQSLATMGVPWPIGCTGDGIARSLRAATIAPTGRPLVTVNCSPRANSDGSFTTVVFSLDAKLQFEQMVAVGDRDSLRNVSTMPDGRLLITHSDGHIGAVTLPAAPRVTRGKLTRLSGAGKRLAKVRIECEGPYGAACSGLVEIRAEGKFLGWAPYALSARPGKARAVFDLSVPLWAGASAADIPKHGRLPASAVARARALPASFTRGAATP